MSLGLMIVTSYGVGIGLASYYNWIVGISAAISAPFFAYGCVRRNGLNFNGFGQANYQDNIANDALINLQVVRAYNLEHLIEDTYIA